MGNRRELKAIAIGLLQLWYGELMREKLSSYFSFSGVLHCKPDGPKNAEKVISS